MWKATALLLLGFALGTATVTAYAWFTIPRLTPVEAAKPRYATMEWEQVLEAKDAGEILCFNSSPLVAYQVNQDSIELALQNGDGLVSIVLYKGEDVYPFVLVQGVPYMVCWTNDGYRHVVWAHPSGAGGTMSYQDAPAPGGFQ